MNLDDSASQGTSDTSDPGASRRQMVGKTIYISGPMTGLPGNNAAAFFAAAYSLSAAGHRPVNPVEVAAHLPPDASWHAFMRADIKALCDCDALALLPGWERSAGAQLELHIAHRLGLEIGVVDRFCRARNEITDDSADALIDAAPELRAAISKATGTADAAPECTCAVKSCTDLAQLRQALTEKWRG